MGQCLSLQAYIHWGMCQAGHSLGASQRVSARAKGPVPGKGLNCTAGSKGAEHQIEGDRHRMPKGATDSNLPGSGLLLGSCIVLSYCLALSTHTPNVMDLPRPPSPGPILQVLCSLKLPTYQPRRLSVSPLMLLQCRCWAPVAAA